VNASLGERVRLMGAREVQGWTRQCESENEAQKLQQMKPEDDDVIPQLTTDELTSNFRAKCGR